MSYTHKGVKAFDRKFGSKFVSDLPAVPGVYRIYDASGALIYVGKAKNLRRRLGQYRNAKRRRKHFKMRAIVSDADRIQYETCASDLDACLLETLLIQEHRPRWNVAGAFYFLYPMIGMKRDGGGTAHFCYTTQPELFPGFAFHGAYRSRYLTREAFFALMKLLSYVGHRIQKRARDAAAVRYSYIYGFRQLPERWIADWSAFWRGESKKAAENLVLALVENAGARHAADEIQERLECLKRFWRFEALALHRARKTAGFEAFPVPQKERDLLFIRAKNARERSAGLTAADHAFNHS